MCSLVEPQKHYYEIVGLLIIFYITLKLCNVPTIIKLADKGLLSL